MKRSFLLMLLLAILLPWVVQAQETITLTSDIEKTIENGIDYTFYDSGGPNASYSSSESFTATFISGGGDITINFSQLTTEASSSCYSWDYMLIYDGDASTGTFLGRAQTGCADAEITTETDYVATSGVMTVVWHSDGSVVAAGWAATVTSETVTCIRPKNLIKEALDGEDFAYSFTWEGDAANYQWLCIPAGEMPNWDNAEEVSSTEAEVSELQPQTDYKFYVRAVCAANDISRVASLAFRTPCGAITTFPWIADFEGNSLDCWTAGNYAEPTSINHVPYIYSYAANNSNYGLRFQAVMSYTSHADSSYVVLPEIDFDADGLGINGHSIFFDAKRASNSAGYNNHLLIGTVKEPGNFSTFVQIADVELSDEWEYYEVSLEDYDADENEGRYIALLAVVDSKSTASTRYGYINVDNVGITPCPTPKNLAVAEIETNSLTFTVDNPEGVLFACVPAGQQPDWDNDGIDSDESSITFEDLQPNTLYVLYAKRFCDDYESPVKTISARTACGVVSELPWVDDFEDATVGEMPLCWSKVQYLQSENSTLWDLPQTYNRSAHSGTNCLLLAGGKTAEGRSDKVTAILPEFEEDIQNLQVSFYHLQTELGENAPAIVVGTVHYDVNDTVFTALAQLDKTNPYRHAVISLANAPADADAIAIRLAGGSVEMDAFIDSVVVELAPACPALRKLEVTDLQRRSISVKLTPAYGSEVSQFQAYISTSELDEAALAAVPEVNMVMLYNMFEYTFEGLDRGTQYYIYARAICESDEPSEWISIGVKTKDLASCESDNVQVIVGEGTGTGYYAPMDSYYKYSWVQTIYPASEVGKVGSVQKIQSIAYDCASIETTKDMAGELSIYMAHTSHSENESTQDWIQAEDLTLVYHVDAWQIPTAAGWTEFALDEPFEYNGTDNLAIVFASKLPNWSSSMKFHYTSVDNAILYRCSDSDVSCGEQPGPTTSGTRSAQRPNIRITLTCEAEEACPTVTEATVELLGRGNHDAQLSWRASGGDFLSGYELILSEEEIDDFSAIDPEEIITKGLELEHIFHNLQSDQRYYIYLRAVCMAEEHDEGKSNWKEIEFSTLPDCPAVVNLEAELTDLNAATVHWEKAIAGLDDSFYYILSEYALDDEVYTPQTPIEINTLSLELEDLEYDKEYWLQVFSKCDDETSSVVMIPIRTLPACQPVENATAANIKHNMVELTWEKAHLAREAQWIVRLEDANGQPIADKLVSELHASFIGLEPETNYTAYIAPVCGDDPAEVSVNFTTIAQPNACSQVGTGTNSTSYYPFAGYYNFSLNEQIYRASEIGRAGKIVSITLFNSSNKTADRTVNIYMKHTNKSAFDNTRDWELVTANDLVFFGTVQISANSDIEIPLATPFYYNGSDNLLLVADDNTGSYTSNYPNYRTYTDAASANTCLYYYSDGTNEDPLTSISAIGNRTSYKNLINFCFESKACPDVAALRALNITDQSAEIRWEPMGSETAWYVYLSESLLSDPSVIADYSLVSDLEYVLGALGDDTDYWFYIRPLCTGADWSYVHFITMPSCQAPTSPAVVAESITATSAEVEWQDTNEVPASQYTIAYGPLATFDLTDASTYLTVDATASPVLLEGLKGNTEYLFAVKGNCGGNDPSRYSATASFLTECGIEELPYEDGFENGVRCWTLGNRGSSYSYYSPTINSSTYHNGANSLYFYADVSEEYDYDYGYSYETYADSAFAVLPELALEDADISSYRIEFFAKSSGTSSSSYSYYHHILIGVASDARINDFELIEDVELSDAFEAYEVSFEDYTGDKNRIVLLAIVDPNSSADARYASVYMDDIKVSELPLCRKPSVISISDLTSDQVTLSWTTSGDNEQFQLLALPSSAEQELDWSKAVIVDGLSTTLNNLAPSTMYNVYLRAYCSATEQSEIREASFMTACAAISTLPWHEGFEDYATGSASSDAFGCWEIPGANQGSRPYVYIKDGANSSSIPYYSEGLHGLFLETHTTGGEAFAILPEFEDLSDAQIAFSYRYENITYGGELDFGYLLDINDETSFVSLHTAERSTSWADVSEISLARIPSSARLAFRLEQSPSTTYYYACVDDINITLLPACRKPDEISVSGLSYNQVTLSWSTTGAQEQFQMIVLPAAEEQELDWESAEPFDGLSKGIEDLTPETEYKVYLRAYCSEDEQSAIREASFTTPPSCFVPTLPQVNEESIGVHQAMIAWTDEHDASLYVVAYGKTSEFNLNDESTFETVQTSSTSVLLSNLDAATEYLFAVKSACGDELGDSRYSATVSFATPMCEASDRCEIRLALTDSYGDGWNGNAAIRVTDIASDEILGTFTNTNAAAKDVPQEYTLSVCDGRSIRFSWITGGNYDNECSYVVYDKFDNVIFEGSGAMNASVDYLVDCTTPACEMPVISDVTMVSNSASITWSISDAEVLFQYVLVASGEQPVWDGVAAVAGMSASLNALQPQRSYDFYVRTYCSAEEQSYARKTSFTTDCGTITALPWDENFEDKPAGDIPSCWDRTDSDTPTMNDANDIIYVWGVIRTYDNQQMLCMNNYWVQEGTALINTPAIALPAAECEFSFDYAHQATCDDLEVRISVDGGAFSTLQSYSNLSGSDDENYPSEWESAVIDLAAYSGHVIKLQFFTTANYDAGAIFVDNLHVDIKEGQLPTGLDDIRGTKDSAQKIIHEHILYIIRNGVWYDATGRRVQKF